MYKKTLLTPLLFFAFFVGTTFGQNIGLGVNTGLNTSSHFNHFKYQTGETLLDFSPSFKMGYSLGLTYRHILGPNLRIQAEPTLTTMGATYNDSFTFRGFEFVTESETDLVYMTLPILVQLTTTPPDLLEFPEPWAGTTYHITAGIYGGYLLDGQFEGTNRGEPIGIEFEGSFSNDIAGQYNDFDAGIIIGGGLEYGLHDKIGIEARGMLGVLNTGNSTEFNFKSQNIAFTLMLYYLF